MHDGAVAVADKLIINAVISFHCSGALVGFCDLRVDYCMYLCGSVWCWVEMISGYHDYIGKEHPQVHRYIVYGQFSNIY